MACIFRIVRASERSKLRERYTTRRNQNVSNREHVPRPFSFFNFSPSTYDLVSSVKLQNDSMCNRLELFRTQAQQHLKWTNSVRTVICNKNMRKLPVYILPSTGNLNFLCFLAASELPHNATNNKAKMGKRYFFFNPTIFTYFLELLKNFPRNYAS